VNIEEFKTWLMLNGWVDAQNEDIFIKEGIGIINYSRSAGLLKFFPYYQVTNLKKLIPYCRKMGVEYAYKPHIQVVLTPYEPKDLINILEDIQTNSKDYSYENLQIITDLYTPKTFNKDHYDNS